LHRTKLLTAIIKLLLAMVPDQRSHPRLQRRNGSDGTGR
jgi:hypothetical protein